MNEQYHRHADLRLTELAGEGVVLHLGERRYFTVNETGLAILNALEQPRTFDEIVASILQEFDVENDVAEQTTRAFLDRCVGANLIRAVEA
jgi:hypothetical protein